MIGGFASAFSALHEIKVGLQCAGTANPVRLLSAPEVDISIFGYPHDDVFPFGSRGQAQGSFEQVHPVLVRIEILRCSPPEGRYPLCCGKEGNAKRTGLLGGTER